MEHIQKAAARATDRYVSYYAASDEVFDPTLIMGIITAIIDFISQCRAGGNLPDRPPEEVAAVMKNPTHEDRFNLWAASKLTAKQKVTKKTSGLRGKALRQARLDYATRAFYTLVDEAAASSIEELTELVKERRAAA